MKNLELKKYICCDYEENRLFGKECIIIDDITYQESYIVEIEGEEYIIYKGNICKNKIDILNKILFVLSDYSDLFIYDIKDMKDLFTIEGVQINLNKNELEVCNNFYELLELAKRIIKILFNNENEEGKEENKEILKKENDYIIYKYGSIYRVHFFTDERNQKVDNFKSFISKDKNILIKTMLKRGYKLDNNLNIINDNTIFEIDKNINSNELYKYVKNTFFKNENNKDIKVLIKFVNKYLDIININNIRIYKHISIDNIKLIFIECDTLDKFISMMNEVKRAYSEGKRVIDTYYNMYNDIEFFKKNNDIEEVNEIKENIQTSIKISNKILMY